VYLKLMAILGAAQVAVAPAPRPASAMEAISRQRLPIHQVRPGVYEGEGWDRLIADGAAAHFFVIGEQHATSDIAKFGAAAHESLAARGYTPAAYEVGPFSTDFAEQLIRSGKGRLAGYIRRPGHAFALPFLFFQEEIDLAEQIVARSPDRVDSLWGLDQEFVGSGPIALELLRREVKTHAQKAAVEAFSVKLAANPMLVGGLTDADLRPLEKAFPADRRSLALLSALRISAQIYAPFTGGKGSGYAANLQRENYMKANLVTRFTAVERRLGKAPKVFMKFGGNHAMKGFTGTNVPGLGNFIYEWGLPRGLGMINIMVDCAGGQALNPQNNQTAPCEPYFSRDAALSKLPKTDKLTLIDLRPLRPMRSRLKDLDAESRKLILAFDYYLVIKDMSAAAPVVQPPAK
jgi:hypothetical protein